jgi:hypothetical protein
MLTETQVATIVEAFPRLQMKQWFMRDVCGIVESRPATTYDKLRARFWRALRAGLHATVYGGSSAELAVQADLDNHSQTMRFQAHE